MKSESIAKKDKSYWTAFIPKSWICCKNYSLDIFRKDLIAGITVGIVALPLAMAFGIASGVGPENGLYTAIIAGFLISLLGGSRVQIGGPTGAFVAIVYGVVQRQGYDGLVLATLIAAILLIITGLCKLGGLIKFIPYPLVTGFTSGIAVIIFSSQIKDFLGLDLGKLPADFLEQWGTYFSALNTIDPLTVAIASGTLLIIILIRSYIPKIPWGITGIVCATLICTLLHLPVETIASRFGEIPRTLPIPQFPVFHISLEKLHSLIPDALVIAFLAGIESLLCAIVADGMTGQTHKSNCELVAQGVANFGSILFGGIPATGAIARTATNIKSGARTPVAGMIHASTLFLIMLLFAPLVGKIPLAALSAVLMMIAWNMCEVGNFRNLLKAPAGDVAILLTAFFLTILADLTVAVEVGMVFAAFLFMKRMSDLPPKVVAAQLWEDQDEESVELKDPDRIAKKHVPEQVEVYEINGPFFFGVADTLKDALRNIEKPPRIFILRMRKVSIIDATGMHALKEFYYKCKKDETTLILSGIQRENLKSLKKFGITKLIGEENIMPHIDAALKRAREQLKKE